MRNDPNFTVPRRAGGSAIDLATAMAETERAEQLILSVAMSSLPPQAHSLASGSLWGGEIELLRMARHTKCRIEVFQHVNHDFHKPIKSLGVYGDEGPLGFALWTRGAEGQEYDRGHFQLLKPRLENLLSHTACRCRSVWLHHLPRARRRRRCRLLDHHSHFQDLRITCLRAHRQCCRRWGHLHHVRACQVRRSGHRHHVLRARPVRRSGHQHQRLCCLPSLLRLS